jgi:hypothetical protein
VTIEEERELRQGLSDGWSERRRLQFRVVHLELKQSEDEGDRRKSRKSSKNLSGLSCFARDGFCIMALSSGSKKSTQSDSDSDSDDEVRDELPFLRQENEQLLSLLDNRDDMLREAKKMRKRA